MAKYDAQIKLAWLHFLIPPEVSETLEESAVTRLTELDQLTARSIDETLMSLDEAALAIMQVLTSSSASTVTAESAQRLVDGQRALRDRLATSSIEALSTMGPAGRAQLADAERRHHTPTLGLGFETPLVFQPRSLQYVISETNIVGNPIAASLVAEDMALNVTLLQIKEQFNGSLATLSLASETIGQDFLAVYGVYSSGLNDAQRARFDIGLRLLGSLSTEERARVIVQPIFTSYLGLTCESKPWSSAMFDFANLQRARLAW